MVRHGRYRLQATEASVQLIMPDTQFLKGTTGKAIKDAFVGNLKNYFICFIIYIHLI